MIQLDFFKWTLEWYTVSKNLNLWVLAALKLCYCSSQRATNYFLLIESFLVCLKSLLVLESNLVLIKIIYNLLSLLVSVALVTSKPEDHVNCAFFRYAVIGEATIVLKLLARKDKSLLVRWDPLLVLNLLLHLVDRTSEF